MKKKFCLGLKYPLFVKQNTKTVTQEGSLRMWQNQQHHKKKLQRRQKQKKIEKKRAHFKTRLPPVARSSKKLYYLRRAVALTWIAKCFVFKASS